MNTTVLKFAASITGIALMLSIETLRPKRAWADSRKRRFLFHMGLSLLNAAIVGVVAVAPFLFFRDIISSRGWGIAPLLGLSGTAEILASLVVLDMLDYWWHRFNHRIPLLWRFHRVHHVDTHVDVTTSLRFHAGELIISSAIVKVTWLLIWGPSFLAFAIFEAAITSASQFHHSNIDFPDHPEAVIRKVIVTPRFHASHHTVSKRTQNANFSTIFIIWDKLFGTYREPDYGEMRRLGLAKGRESYLSLSTTLKGPFVNN